MSTAIAPVNEQKKQAITFGNTGVKLSTFEDAFRFSTAVANSGWAPKGMEKAESVLVAIQFGLEIGLSPMAALQNTAVINGRPGIYGDAALALVRSSDRCLHFSEAETSNETETLFRELQFAMVEKNTEQVRELSKKLSIAQSKHKLDADDFGVSCATLREDASLEFGRFTVGDAKKANLWGKAGPWSQYPKRMLKFRARGFLLRDVYGDVLKGLRTIEELQDIPPERNVTGTADRPSLSEMLAPAKQEALPAPAAEASVVAVVATEPALNREEIAREIEEYIIDARGSETSLLKEVLAAKLIENPDGLALFELPTADLVKVRAYVAAKAQESNVKGAA